MQVEKIDFNRHDEDTHPLKKSVSFVKRIFQSFGLIIAAPLLALFLTAHVFQPYQVDGLSMETTLQNGDRLIVYKLPRTLSNISGSDYTLHRWDIIVFDRPRKLRATDSAKHLIKRVIGLPGERVTIDKGIVTVYNKDTPEGFNPDKDQDYAKGLTTEVDNPLDITVGQNEIFVLGDNRDNSSDSRIFGAIPTSSVVGKATARFVPANNMTTL